IRFAAAAAEALEDYVSESGGDTEREELLDEFRLASVALNDAVARQDALDTAYQSRVDAGVATGADLEVLTAAQADVDRARLEAETLADAYRESRGRSGRAGNLDLVAPAASSGDDSRSALQLAIAGPILLGAVAGVALATIVANRKGLPAHAAVPGRS
ncbi:MAG TPA: hypothetical protein VEA99_07300, partial [Gemmatimonadaceae bacterium]|nr:hypothetical protein [Gemmatimonadaceae bacterium]